MTKIINSPKSVKKVHNKESIDNLEELNDGMVLIGKHLTSPNETSKSSNNNNKVKKIVLKKDEVDMLKNKSGVRRSYPHYYNT